MKEKSTGKRANALAKTKSGYFHRFNKNVQVDASVGPADVSTTQSITLHFGKATFVTLAKKHSKQTVRI